MAQGHSIDEYLETIYFLAFPIGEYTPPGGGLPLASRVAEMLGVSRASAGEMLKRLEADGLIGGGPTFFGTVLGQAWVSEALSVAVLALAAGSILYVVGELMNVGRMFGNKMIVMSGILLGLVLGFGTDFILVAAGA